MKKKLLLAFFLFGINYANAQNTISGTVSDSESHPLPGASVVEKGTTNGVITDVDGKYSLQVDNDAVLIFGFVGFKSKEVSVGSQSIINMSLVPQELSEVIIVGTRTAPRSDTDTPLPVDVVGAKELLATGQTSFDKALQYRIPSFNTVQSPVNDATAILDPYEIRNMGPSRTLILVNGKRKNLSSLLYVQTSPGRGETGADISAIPQDAIERVEILRDGASAQYGSDAIAGVMNIILKDDVDYGSVTLRTGVSSAGDGDMYSISLNSGTTIGNDKGFLNYTIDLSSVNQANRPGKVSAEGEFADFLYIDPNSYKTYLEADGVTLGETNIEGFTETQKEAEFNNVFKNSPEYDTALSTVNASNDAGRATVKEFLGRKPDAGNINGSPKNTAAKFLVNGSVNLSTTADLYFNAAYVYKKVNSFANYRTPYWRTLNDLPYLSSFFPASGVPGGYDGYGPTFDGDLNDFNATLGFKGKNNGWNYDGSATIGGNSQAYTIRSTHNGSKALSPATWVDTNGNGEVDSSELTPSSILYRENSKISFDPGGTRFNHIVGNIDISRVLSDHFSIGVGTEFRSETFTVVEGELGSYDGGGPDSFSGNDPKNSGKFNRYNFGAYFDLAWDISKDFLLNGTVRTESYSDFGSAFVWKLSSRYKFLEDKVTLRASASTGFRAPTLHQIYTQKAQYSFSPGKGIQVGGLISNVSPQARLLDIPQLTAEESTNITVGLGVKASNSFNFTLDYYDINVTDRIILSTEITPTEAGNTALDQVLNDNGIIDLSFFINGIDTRTSGLDFVGNYRDINLGAGKLHFSLSGNYTLKNEKVGDVNNPQLIKDAEQSVINKTQEALFFTSRPKTKWILGANYEVGKIGLALNGTLFGKTTFKQEGMSKNLRTEFSPKLVTDLAVTYNATHQLTIALSINNLLNVFPEWEFVAENDTGQEIIDDKAITTTGLTEIENQSNLITFNQRYSQMTYDGFHFSQLGALFNLSVNYKF